MPVLAGRGQGPRAAQGQGPGAAPEQHPAEQHPALAARLQAQQRRLLQQQAEQEAWVAAAREALARHGHDDAAPQHGRARLAGAPAPAHAGRPPLSPAGGDRAPPAPRLSASPSPPPGLAEARLVARQGWQAKQPRQDARLAELEQLIDSLQEKIDELQATARQRRALLAAAEAASRLQWAQVKQRWREELAAAGEPRPEWVQLAAAAAAAAQLQQQRRRLQQDALAGAPHRAALPPAAAPWVEPAALGARAGEAGHAQRRAQGWPGLAAAAAGGLERRPREDPEADVLQHARRQRLAGADGAPPRWAAPPLSGASGAGKPTGAARLPSPGVGGFKGLLPKQLSTLEQEELLLASPALQLPPKVGGGWPAGGGRGGRGPVAWSRKATAGMRAWHAARERPAHPPPPLPPRPCCSWGPARAWACRA